MEGRKLEGWKERRKEGKVSDMDWMWGCGVGWGEGEGCVTFF